MISTRFKLAVASGAVAGAGLVGGFGPFVRYEVGQAAARYGAEVAVDRVIPTLAGVRLEGIEVALDEVPAAKIHLDRVEVSYRSGSRSVALQGGSGAAVGPREVVLRQAEAWRAHHLGTDASASGGASGRSSELAGLRLQWQNASSNPTEVVTADGLRVARSGGALTVSASAATIQLGRTSVEVKGGHVELTRSGTGGYRLAALGADGVEAQLTLPSGKAEPRKDPGVVPAAAGDAGGGSAGLGSALRATLVGAARSVDAFLDPGAQVRVQGVHARIHRGGDTLNLGPGTFQVNRSGAGLVVELSPDLRSPAPVPGRPAAEKEEALTFRLAVPLGDSGPQEIAADVQGGPIWLSSLGIQEGDFGLFDLGHASLSTRSHVILPADGRSVRVDGEGKLHSLSIRSSALSDEPVAGLELAFRVKGEAELDGSRLRVTEGEVDLGAIRLILQGDYERAKEAHRVHASFDVPITACQAMLDSTPKGLVPKLAGMRLAGSFALRGRADFDTAHLDKSFHVTWDASTTCRITEAPPAINVERFRHPFKRTAYDAEGRPIQLETGPGTNEWVPMGSISKYMEIAVQMTEDAGFHRHHGFDHEAIKNSIRENLRARKFVRGASTVSMQLAKNLYLDRGKNVSRKLQEAVFTMYLEQELTKEQILELYFNVVEFGPMVYGIGPAARNYFNASAAELSLGQSLYLSSILPNPKVSHFGAGGAVGNGWMNFLRKLMKYARMKDKITEEEFDEGLRETVVRGSPAPHRASKPFSPVGAVDADAPEVVEEPLP